MPLQPGHLSSVGAAIGFLILISQGTQRWLETCGFGLYQPQRELTIGASVARGEVSDVLGDGGACDIAAGLNFERDVFRDVLRPMLKRVEGDNADRVVELSRHQIGG